MSRVTCHMSWRVTCHMSLVTCHVSHVTCRIFFFLLFFYKAYRWRVCYQWGLPRLVHSFIHSFSEWVSQPFPPTALCRRHAQTVRISTSSYKIDYIIMIKNFLNPEGYQNPFSGSWSSSSVQSPLFQLVLMIQWLKAQHVPLIYSRQVNVVMFSFKTAI